MRLIKQIAYVCLALLFLGGCASSGPVVRLIPPSGKGVLTIVNDFRGEGGGYIMTYLFVSENGVRCPAALDPEDLTDTQELGWLVNYHIAAGPHVLDVDQRTNPMNTGLKHTLRVNIEEGKISLVGFLLDEVKGVETLSAKVRIEHGSKIPVGVEGDIKALIVLLNSPLVVDRIFAAKTLERTSDEAAVKALKLANENDEHIMVRRIAFHSLWQISQNRKNKH